jgi:hypothetical protein
MPMSCSVVTLSSFSVPCSTCHVVQDNGMGAYKCECWCLRRVRQVRTLVHFPAQIVPILSLMD